MPVQDTDVHQNFSFACADCVSRSALCCDYGVVKYTGDQMACVTWHDQRATIHKHLGKAIDKHHAFAAASVCQSSAESMC